ncbi:MAG: hypothetical protein JNM38_02990, partial [Acidobacteria bacterium]|nr:hypothetical protein [Acidobacteriota bacterium]
MSVLWKASAAASALVFVSALEVSGQTVIDDREFVSWSHFSRVMDDPNAVGIGPGTSTSSGGQQDVTVGNPAPAFVAVHTIRYGDLILTGGIKEDVTYAPGQSGAIGRIDVSVDLRQFVIGVTAWQLVLRQGGKLYYSYPWREFSYGAWRSVSWEGLTAESFDTNPAAGRFGVNPDGDTPDFSAGASPLQFGIAVLNNLGRSGTVINTIAVDNFRVTLTPRDYQITGQVRDLND